MAISRHEVSRWEREERLPSPYWQAWQAQTFDVPEVTLRRAVGVTRARRRRSVEAVAAEATIEPGGGSFSATGSANFLTRVDNTNIGEVALGEMLAEVRRIARAYLKTETTFPLAVRAEAVRDSAASLLEGHQRPAQTRDLYVAAGWAMALLAWAAVDQGDLDASRTHSSAAWFCAEQADHNSLRAWVRACQNATEYWAGDLAGALALAHDGLRYADGHATVLLGSAVVTGSAALGKRDEAIAQLARLREFELELGDDELGGLFSCGRERAAGTGRKRSSPWGIRQRRCSWRPMRFAVRSRRPPSCATSEQSG